MFEVGPSSIDFNACTKRSATDINSFVNNVLLKTSSDVDEMLLQLVNVPHRHHLVIMLLYCMRSHTA